MTSTRALRLAFVATVVAAALAAAPSVGAGSSHKRPLAGVCKTSFTQQPSGVIDITGNCLITHLGKATYTATQTIAPNPDGTVAITITGAYTAANGDMLRSTLTGTGRFTSETTVSYQTTETFAGGTGRFADATGTATVHGAARFTGPTTGESVYASLGWIAF